MEVLTAKFIELLKQRGIQPYNSTNLRFFKMIDDKKLRLL